MNLLVDLDSLLYKAVYKICDYQTIKQWFCQGQTKDWMRREIVELSVNRMVNMMDHIIHEIEQTGIVCDDVEYYLTVCPKSKRKILYPDYKVKRKPNKWVSLCRKYLLDANFAIHHPEWEADDLVADRAGELGETECCIVSMDKDLKNIPGVHFNFYRPRAKADEYGILTEQEMVGLAFVSSEDAYYNFWSQMLIGDSTDNIKGAKGIGKVRAAKILNESENFKLSVQEAYQKAFGIEWEKEYQKNHFLLKLGTKREKSGDLLTEALNDSIRLTKTMEGLLK